MLKGLTDLDAVTERIVAVHGMSADLMPGDLGRILSPVELALLEPTEDRWIVLVRNAEVDVRALDPLYSLREPVDSLENDQLAGHGDHELCLVFTRDLIILYQAERISVPGDRLLQLEHLDTDMADAPEGNRAALGRIVARITSDRKLDRVAVWVQQEQRFLNSTR